MALIEHLEREKWEEFFQGAFQYTLEVPPATFLAELVRESRRALVDLTATSVIPLGGQAPMDVSGVSETDFRNEVRAGHAAQMEQLITS